MSNVAARKVKVHRYIGVCLHFSHVRRYNSHIPSDVTHPRELQTMENHTKILTNEGRKARNILDSLHTDAGNEERNRLARANDEIGHSRCVCKYTVRTRTRVCVVYLSRVRKLTGGRQRGCDQRLSMCPSRVRKREKERERETSERREEKRIQCCPPCCKSTVKCIVVSNQYEA